jgi:hypothetical protein
MTQADIKFKHDDWQILDVRMKREKTGHTRTMWLARCQCGDTKWRSAAHIREGRAKQCHSCAERTHGGSKTREYAAWYAMIHRCTNPANKFFARYGGRGIRVCQTWLDYRTFLRDMGPCPPRQTLERVDNDGPYSKSNCVWASRQQQAANKSNNVVVFAFGRSQHLAAWVAELGIPYARVWHRIKVGWTAERALTQEVQHGHK